MESSHRTKGLLRLTMACNERCPFCNVPVEDYPRPTPEEAEIEAELAAFVASGQQTLTISGGEPTLLRKRLLTVISRARAQGVPFVELQTNAVLIDAARALELREAGLTSAFVSLLSDDPALHDELAGLPGAFPRCLAGIDALLDAGVRVTLNPVIARITQDRVTRYVRFVAARLPGVRSISLSAVQPHGRAAARPELLPEYAALGEEVRAARAAAAEARIEILNPYCGLPLCVGWSADRERSVEAVEAEAGGWRETPGIENIGDKEQRGPCLRCALRTRCGGAWRAWWEDQGGRGLTPPAEIVEPWVPGADAAPEQGVVRAPGRPGAEHWAALQALRCPTRWLAAGALERGDAERAALAGATDIAVELDPARLRAPEGKALLRTLAELKGLLAASADRPPQRRCRVHLRLTRPDPELQAWARAHGANCVTTQ